MVTATVALNPFMAGSAATPATGLDDDGALDGLGGSNERTRIGEKARIAAKQRRQKILVVVLVGVLVALLAYELPKLINGSGGNTSAVSAAPAASIPSPEGKRLQAAGKGADPFAVKSLPNGDAHAAGGGGPDPFTKSSGSSSTSVASTPAAFPKQIVIGRPGGHRVAKRGWIVILASIPARNGRRALCASQAPRGRVGWLSSSTRLSVDRCAAVTGSSTQVRTQRWPRSRDARDIHAAGYRAAYIREVTTYR